MLMRSLVNAFSGGGRYGGHPVRPPYRPGLVSVGGGGVKEVFPPPAAAAAAFQVGGGVKGAAARSGLAFRSSANDEP